MGAYALLRRLNNEGLKTPVQVYRILSKLVTEGLVHRIETLNAYVFRRPDQQESFGVYAICDNCGQVDEVADDAVGTCLKQCADRQDFLLKSTAVEIRGLCPTCVLQQHPENARDASRA